MSIAPLNICLYGTEEPVAAPKLLHAGNLSAELEAGNLRHVRYAGREIIRAISFIVRDRDWGTCTAQIHDLVITDNTDHVEVRYHADVDHRGQRLSYAARIVATPAELTFSARAQALTDFETNRAGFVILHPLDGVVGAAATVEHADGSVEATCFPELISPLQPMLDMRAISHEPAPGLRVRCLMEGDVFEMEDQRNWTDASYKTYVRPLALPWPYTIKQGEMIEQAITLAIDDAMTATPSATSGSITLSIAAPSPSCSLPPIRRLPPIGVGLSQAELADTQAQLARLAPLQPRHVVYHHDPRTSSVTDLARAAELIQALGAEPWLEAVVASVEEFEAEIAELGQVHAQLGAPFKVVLVSPAADLKATLPGSPWPPAPPLIDLYRVARRAFPSARLGGGMFSYFTELNRKRPPLEDIDLVTFTTTAILHAGDDATVIENLASLPSLTASVRHIASGKPFVVGPSAIGMRMNPYGDAPVKNLANTRQAMNENDPRQRGLLGAAWALAYVTQMTHGGAQAIALGGTTGAQGVLAVPQTWPQPYFDATLSSKRGGYFPVFHVQRLLAQFSGSALLDTSADSPDVAVLALRQDGATTVLIANLTPEPISVALPGEMTGLRMLDATSFEEATRHADFFDTQAPAAGQQLALTAYAVARVTLLAWSPV